MDYRKIDYIIFYILLLVSTVILVYISLFSIAHYEGSESIYHYFHSAAIFEHPEIALNHWGKPLFIALSSPFTYFGEKGVMIFNSIVMLLAAFYTFKLGRRFGYKLAFPLVILVLYSPVYLKFSQSCLTEPLFGLIAIVSAYLFIQEKYTLSAIVISFVIYSRSEGMMFIPIYAVLLLLRRQYKVLPYLLTGFIVYSFIGLLIGKGFFWYYYEYPYKSIYAPYGKGPFWHWFTNQKYITGTPFSLMLILSTVAIFTTYLFRLKSVFIKENLVFICLIFAPALVYVFGHSFLWYKGLSASIGLYRIVGGVIPLLAMIAMFGVDKLVKMLSVNRIGGVISVVLLLLLSFWVVSFTYKDKNSVILLQPNEMEKTINKSMDWIDNNGLSERTMYVFQAHYISKYNGDHFDKYHSNIRGGVDNRENPHEQLKSGELLIFDKKVSPIEGGITILDIDTNYFKSLKIFIPEHEFTVFGGGTYFIQIFERK